MTKDLTLKAPLDSSANLQKLCACGHAAQWHKPRGQRSPVRRCLGDERPDGRCECTRSREQVVTDGGAR